MTVNPEPLEWRMAASVVSKIQGALLKATQPPLPDVPPAAGFRSAEYRLAAIPRLPGERVAYVICIESSWFKEDNYFIRSSCEEVQVFGSFTHCNYDYVMRLNQFSWL